MRDYIAALLLLIGFWWSPAWLLAWIVGRKCNVCEHQREMNKHRPRAEIISIDAGRSSRL